MPRHRAFLPLVVALLAPPATARGQALRAPIPFDTATRTLPADFAGAPFVAVFATRFRAAREDRETDAQYLARLAGTATGASYAASLPSDGPARPMPRTTPTSARSRSACSVRRGTSAWGSPTR
jgi:hypothetical protein